MSFAICYEFSDLSAMAGTLNAQSISNALKNEARRYWNGGLNAWDSAPLGVFPGEPPDSCPQCRIVTCSYGTIPGLIQLLRDVAADFASRGVSTEATQYMLALAGDLAAAPIGANSSGRDPWP